MAGTCLSLTGKTLTENAGSVLTYRPYIDLLELRADFLSPQELHHIARFPDMVDVPVILTIRRERDGGLWGQEERERHTVLKRGLAGRYSYADLEIDFENEPLERYCADQGITIIRSLHQFSGVPDTCRALIDKLGEKKGEIPKYAGKPNSTAELITLIKASASVKGRQSIVLGIGPFGFSTRILAEKLGNFFTYTSPPGKTAAEGHLDPESLHTVYRYGSITPSTAVYGIIGNPVLHTKSPLIHNRGFDMLGFDAVYVPFHCDDVSHFFTAARLLGVRGISVTIPFKEAIIPYLSEASEEVTAAAACNTAKPLPSGAGWRGENFDIDGFLAPLFDLVADKGSRSKAELLGGMRASVIGAGGAARSVVYALTRSGAEVAVFNRSEHRARQLASEFGCSYGKLDDSEKIAAYNDLIVQATSVGMNSHPGNPIESYQFRGDEIAYDLIYNPPETSFLSKAKAAGCRVINGEQMLFRQAMEQFRFFTDRMYPGGISAADMLREE